MQVSCQPLLVVCSLFRHDFAHQLSPTVATEFVILHIAMMLHGLGITPWVGVNDNFAATFAVFSGHNVTTTGMAP